MPPRTTRQRGRGGIGGKSIGMGLPDPEPVVTCADRGSSGGGHWLVCPPTPTPTAPPPHHCPPATPDLARMSSKLWIRRCAIGRRASRYGREGALGCSVGASGCGVVSNWGGLLSDRSCVVTANGEDGEPALSGSRIGHRPREFGPGVRAATVGGVCDSW